MFCSFFSSLPPILFLIFMFPSSFLHVFFKFVVPSLLHPSSPPIFFFLRLLIFMFSCSFPSSFFPSSSLPPPLPHSSSLPPIFSLFFIFMFLCSSSIFILPFLSSYSSCSNFLSLHPSSYLLPPLVLLFLLHLVFILLPLLSSFSSSCSPVPSGLHPSYLHLIIFLHLLIFMLSCPLPFLLSSSSSSLHFHSFPHFLHLPCPLPLPFLLFS